MKNRDKMQMNAFFDGFDMTYYPLYFSDVLKRTFKFAKYQRDEGWQLQFIPSFESGKSFSQVLMQETAKLLLKTGKWDGDTSDPEFKVNMKNFLKNVNDRVTVAFDPMQEKLNFVERRVDSKWIVMKLDGQLGCFLRYGKAFGFDKSEIKELKKSILQEYAAFIKDNRLDVQDDYALRSFYLKY